MPSDFSSTIDLDSETIAILEILTKVHEEQTENDLIDHSLLLDFEEEEEVKDE